MPSTQLRTHQKVPHSFKWEKPALDLNLLGQSDAALFRIGIDEKKWLKGAVYLIRDNIVLPLRGSSEIVQGKPVKLSTLEFSGVKIGIRTR